MNEYRAFLDLMDIAKANGFWWDKGFEPVLVRGERIVGNTHVRIVLGPAFLEYVYGEDWREVGHAAYDIWLDREGGMLDWMLQEAIRRRDGNHN